jgi:hypothetical protein
MEGREQEREGKPQKDCGRRYIGPVKLEASIAFHHKLYY